MRLCVRRRECLSVRGSECLVGLLGAVGCRGLAYAEPLAEHEHEPLTSAELSGGCGQRDSPS